MVNRDGPPAGRDTADTGPAVHVLPGPLRAAIALIGVEALGLVAAAAVLVVKTITGSPEDIWRALLGAALALGGAACLGYACRGLRNLRAAARSPVIVIELLALPVSYSLAFQAGRVEYGGPIMVIALVVLFLLFTPPVRAALDR